MLASRPPSSSEPTHNPHFFSIRYNIYTDSDVADAWIFTYSTATVLSHLGVIEGGAQK